MSVVAFIATNGWTDLCIIAVLLAIIPFIARTGAYL